MPDDTPTPLSLRRVEPALNMKRFYTLTLQPTLFGEVTLIRHWGRIGTRGQNLIETFADQEAAVSAFTRLARSKRARGYVPPA